MSEKWDERGMALARCVASFSRDPSTQCGCVLMDARHRIVGTGFNGFARGCDDDASIYADRERKYRRVIHSEVNAVLNAVGATEGTTAYVVPFPPCSNCAAVLIQAGVVRVVCPAASAELAARWGESNAEAVRMFAEAGVEFVTVAGA